VSPQLLALGAIGLWASLAGLGVALSHVPPFLLTGLALLVGGLIALPLSRFDLRTWRVPASTLALGVYGLFGFHFLLFIALRHAPPVQANLVNYLWPLGIVLMAPLFLPGVRLSSQHVLAALLGFAGAALAILGRGGNADAVWAWGSIPALGSAFIWASYSLLTQRVAAFPTAAIGGFAWVSGALALLCHAWLEPSVALSGTDWVVKSHIHAGGRVRKQRAFPVVGHDADEFGAVHRAVARIWLAARPPCATAWSSCRCSRGPTSNVSCPRPRWCSIRRPTPAA
jgi:drug/metabolite transporter (DMT)-like permease